MVRVAVAEGISPEDAIVMATINPATYHRLWHLGAVAPGYQADILVLDDLKSFNPRQVLKRGAARLSPSSRFPSGLRQTMHLAPVDAASFACPPAPSAFESSRDSISAAHRNEVVEPSVREGAIVADPGRDLAKIAVLERHHATGRIGLGFDTNIGLEAWRLASTVRAQMPTTSSSSASTMPTWRRRRAPG